MMGLSVHLIGLIPAFAFFLFALFFEPGFVVVHQGFELVFVAKRTDRFCVFFFVDV